MREGIADILGQKGFLRDARQLSSKPGLERGDDRGGLGAPDGETVGGSLAAHGLLDLIQQCDLAQHLLGDGRALAFKALHEATADMGPAIDQLPRPLIARDLGQRVVGLVGVTLQEPAAVSGEEL